MKVNNFVDMLKNQEFDVKNIYKSEIYKNIKEEEVKVGVYARISKDKEDEISVARQQSQLARFLDRVGINKDQIEFYKDEGISGTSSDRPGYLKMINDAYLGKINVVLVARVDRFGRDFNSIYRTLYDTFYNTNTMFISLDNKVINTEDDVLEIVEHAIIAEKYAQSVSRYTREALRELWESGSYTGKGLYGYDVKVIECIDEYGEEKRKRILTIKKDSSPEIVRRIFAMYLSGMGYDKIANHLSKEEIISPRGDKKWCGNTIKMILENPLYCGKLAQGRYKKAGYKKTSRDKKIIKLNENEWFHGEEFQGIVSKEIFNEVQKQIAARSNKGNREDKPHLFSGLLKCAKCGKALVYKERSKGYKCSGSQDGSRCSTHLVKEEELIQLVKREFQKFYFDEVKLEERLVYNYNGLYEIDKVDKMIDLKNRQKEKYYDLISDAEFNCLDGKIDEEELERKSENFRICIKKINQDIKSLEDKKLLISKIEEQVKQIIIIFKNFEMIDNGILKLLIKRINVYQHGQIEIIWNMKNRPAQIKKAA